MSISGIPGVSTGDDVLCGIRMSSPGNLLLTRVSLPILITVVINGRISGLHMVSGSVFSSLGPIFFSFSALCFPVVSFLISAARTVISSVIRIPS